MPPPRRNPLVARVFGFFDFCGSDKNKNKRNFIGKTIWPLPVEKIKCFLRPIHAFTLAEVLITLTIIGVIAAITIPNLMKKWEDHHTVVAVKEVYAILNNAIKLAVRENGPIESWNYPNNITSVKIVEMLLPYLKTAKYCGIPNTTKDYSCTPKTNNQYTYKQFSSNTAWAESLAVLTNTQLANGMILYLPASPENYASGGLRTTPHPTDGTLGVLMVDINGKKGPNKFAYDVFRFGFGNDGLIVNSEKSNTGAGNTYVRTSCQSPNSGDGFACGRYVILFGDVDYKYKNIQNKWPTVAWW